MAFRCLYVLCCWHYHSIHNCLPFQFHYNEVGRVIQFQKRQFSPAFHFDEPSNFELIWFDVNKQLCKHIKYAKKPLINTPACAYTNCTAANTLNIIKWQSERNYTEFKVNFIYWRNRKQSVDATVLFYTIWHFAHLQVKVNDYKQSACEYHCCAIIIRLLNFSSVVYIVCGYLVVRCFVEMFSFFNKTTKRTMKGYKITAIDRGQKYGVAADSLKMLIEKASAKLKVSHVSGCVFMVEWASLALNEAQ